MDDSGKNPDNAVAAMIISGALILTASFSPAPEASALPRTTGASQSVSRNPDNTLATNICRMSSIRTTRNV